MNQTPYIILDVPNLSHRNWHALDKNRVKLPVVFGLLRDLHTLARILGSTRFLFCFDSDRCVRRKLYPEYKVNRRNPTDRQEVEIQMQLLREEFLPLLGYHNVFRRAGAEADDLMAVLTAQLRGEAQVILVSTDQDLWQLVDDLHVVIWNPSLKRTINALYLWDNLQVHPSEMVTFKSLVGCPSDNIPGVPGIGELRASLYLRNLLDDTYLNIIKQHRDLLASNMQLIQLPCSLLPDIQLRVVQDDVGLVAWNDVVSSVNMDALLNKVPAP